MFATFNNGDRVRAERKEERKERRELFLSGDVSYIFAGKLDRKKLDRGAD